MGSAKYRVELNMLLESKVQCHILIEKGQEIVWSKPGQINSFCQFLYSILFILCLLSFCIGIGWLFLRTTFNEYLIF